jgi:hypothetical protein
MASLRRHRQWVLLISVAVLVLGVATAVSFAVVERVSKGPAFTAAAEFIQVDPDARQQLGVITSFGIAVSGGVRESGASGLAELSFDVNGSWRDGKAKVLVRKKAGKWTVVGVALKVDGRTFDLGTQPIPQ